MNAIKGDLLDAGRNVMEAVIDEGAPGIDGHCSRVRRQLEGWRSQKQRNYQDKDSRNQSKDVLGVYLTRHYGVGFGQSHLSGAGLFLGGVKGYLRGTEADLKLTVFSSCLRIMVLGCPPLPEETPGVVAIVGIGGVQR